MRGNYGLIRNHCSIGKKNIYAEFKKKKTKGFRKNAFVKVNQKTLEKGNLLACYLELLKSSELFQNQNRQEIKI